MAHLEAEIVHLYVSPGHNYFGRHGQEAAGHATVEVDEVACVAGCGIEGDRFFNFKKDYAGQITFFEMEVYEGLCSQFPLVNKPPGVFRRNILTRGVELRTLIGKEFEVQGIRFLGTQESKPCHWMNEAFAPGAEEALRGKGGLRAQILSDGLLRRTSVCDPKTGLLA